MRKRPTKKDRVMPELRKITRDTLGDILALKVKVSQQGLVAPNMRTVAQAAYEPHSWIRAVYDGNRAVGLIAMIDLQQDHPDYSSEDPENAVYLWRLMIDGDAQGKGYGRFAMQAAFAQAQDWGRVTICTSVVPRDDSALKFYEAFGLRKTGRIEDGEDFLQGPVPPE